MASLTYIDRLQGAMDLLLRIYQYRQDKNQPALAQVIANKASTPSSYLLSVWFHKGPYQAILVQETAEGQYEIPSLSNNSLIGLADIPWPIAMGLEKAIELKEHAGHRGEDNLVTLMLPVYPGDISPIYAFGTAAPYVFVNTVTGIVTTGN